MPCTATYFRRDDFTLPVTTDKHRVEHYDAVADEFTFSSPDVVVCFVLDSVQYGTSVSTCKVVIFHNNQYKYVLVRYAINFYFENQR